MLQAISPRLGVRENPKILRVVQTYHLNVVLPGGPLHSKPFSIGQHLCFSRNAWPAVRRISCPVQGYAERKHLIGYDDERGFLALDEHLSLFGVKLLYVNATEGAKVEGDRLRTVAIVANYKALTVFGIRIVIHGVLQT